jgi:hypothetical protein
VPEISVVIPLTDARGDAIEHLRSWTHGQTLARDRFQMVVVSDGDDPSLDQAVASMLEEHDVFDLVPGGTEIQLWNAGAKRVSSRWMLVSENHCEAKPDTVARALDALQEFPELDGVTLQQEDLPLTPAGELCARWSQGVKEEWPEGRLNLAGFAIRREAYQAAGGLESDFGLFATPLLWARLTERGGRVKHLPDARIVHFHVEGIDEHHDQSANYARGECEARRSLDPEFAERYFGHQHLLWNRRGLSRPVARSTAVVLSREIARTGRHHRDRRWLVTELASRLPAAAAGAAGERLLARLALAWSERMASLGRLSFARRFSHVLRGQDRAVREAQLQWIEANPDGEGTRLPTGANEIEQLGPSVVTGVHGLERHDGRLFRWGEPVLTVRLDPSAGGGELEIDAGGLRGSPIAVLAAAYLGTSRLSEDRLREDGERLVVAIPPGEAGDLTLLCRPMEDTAGRRLGLPLFSVDLRGQGAGEARRQVAVPQPAG